MTGASSPAVAAAACCTVTETAAGSGATGAAATGPSDGTGSAADAAASATAATATGTDCDTGEAATTMDVWVVCQYCHPNHDTTASSMPPSKAATSRRTRACGLGAADGVEAPTMACAAWRAVPVIGSRTGVGAEADSARGCGRQGWGRSRNAAHRRCGLGRRWRRLGNRLFGRGQGQRPLFAALQGIKQQAHGWLLAPGSAGSWFRMRSGMGRSASVRWGSRAW